MLLHNVLICGLLLLGLLSLAEARRVCKDHSRHCRQIGNKRPLFRCYRKSTQERCCATCRKYERPNTPECLYGDKLAWCSSIGNRYRALSCYTHELECCEKCGSLYNDQIKDCPYGDREIWCSYFKKENCKNKASRSACCETCHHLLHGDTAHTHTALGNETSTVSSVHTESAHAATDASGDRNATSTPLAANSSISDAPTEPTSALSKSPTPVATVKVTENHTDTSPIGGTLKGTLLPGQTGSTVTPFIVNQSSTVSPTPETPGGGQSTVLPGAGITRSVSVWVSTVSTPTSSMPPERTQPPIDKGKRNISATSAPAVTYKTGTGTSRATSLSSIVSSTPAPTSTPSSAPSPSSSGHSSTSASPLVVTELHIRLQDTIAPSASSSRPEGEGEGGGENSHPSSYLPSLEDDEDYALAQASGEGDNDITIDDVVDERGGGRGGHHHDGDRRRNNGGHHNGGHHHKKGHHKNGVTQEDYIFDDFRSSSARLAPWRWTLLTGLVFSLAIMGESWRLLLT